VRLKFGRLDLFHSHCGNPGTFTSLRKASAFVPYLRIVMTCRTAFVNGRGRRSDGVTGHWLLHDDVGAHVDQRHIRR